MVVWFSLLIYYRCVMVKDGDDEKLSETHVFATRASSFRATNTDMNFSSTSMSTLPQRKLQTTSTEDVAKRVTEQLQPKIESMIQENQKTLDEKVQELNRAIEQVKADPPVKRPPRRRTRPENAEEVVSDEYVETVDRPKVRRTRAARNAAVDPEQETQVAETATVRRVAKLQAASPELNSEEPVYNETHSTTEQMKKILKKIETDDE